MIEPLMEIHEDIFTHHGIICHGCNTLGVMKAGLALQMRYKLPDMYMEYHRLCLNGHLRPGNVFEYKNDSNSPIKYVFNLMTQDTLGKASLSYIEKSITVAIDMAKEKGYDEFAIPQLGCGLGKLNWSEVRKVIKRIAEEKSFRVIVYIR